MSALREPSAVSPETRAHAAFVNGLGFEDIAVALYGRANEENTAKARALVDAGRRKAARAH